MCVSIYCSPELFSELSNCTLVASADMTVGIVIIIKSHSYVTRWMVRLLGYVAVARWTMFVVVRIVPLCCGLYVVILIYC